MVQAQGEAIQAAVELVMASGIKGDGTRMTDADWLALLTVVRGQR